MNDQERNIFLGPVPNKDMQTTPLPLPPQKWPYLHEWCAQCWIEWKILIQIFFIFIFWVMTDCIYNLKVAKFCSKVAKFTAKMGVALKMISKFMNFCCATFSFWGMVDFDVCDHMQNRPYLKN